MVYCSIRKCFNRHNKGGEVGFYSFPKDGKMIQTWLQFCKPNTKPKIARVCSVHFTDSDKIQSLRLRHILMNESPKRVRQLKEDAVPSLFVSDSELSRTTVTDVSYQTHSDDGTAEQNRVGIANSIQNIKQERNSSENSSSVLNETGLLRNMLLKKPKNEQKTPSQVMPSSLPSYHQAKIQPSCSMQGTEESCNNVKEYYVPLTNGPEPIHSILDSSDTVIVTSSRFENLMDTERKYKQIMKKLRRIFTPGQIRALLPLEEADERKNIDQVRWCTKDIEAAFAFRNITPKGYEYMREVRGVPLPGYSTLAKWESKFGIKDDHLKNGLIEAKLKPKKSLPKNVGTTLKDLKVKSKNLTPKKSFFKNSAPVLIVMPKEEMSAEDVSKNLTHALNPGTEMCESVVSKNAVEVMKENPNKEISKEVSVQPAITVEN